MASAVKRVLHVAADKAAVGAESAAFVMAKAAEAVAARGKFTCAISGGSLPAILCSGLQALAAAGADFSQWHVFFADERVVPLDSDDSNFKAVADEFAKAGVTVPRAQIYSIEDPVADPAEVAKGYETRLQEVCGAEAELDLVLLGMGPDGHTASLFPGHSLLSSEQLVDSIVDSPKPPPKRITLTLKALARARDIAFITAGDGKAPMLRAILEPSPDEADSLPAQLPAPQAGEVHWFVDKGAAGELKGKL